MRKKVISFSKWLNEHKEESTQKFDVTQTLVTMLEGDDVDFEPLESDDPIWKKLGLETFALNPPEDVEKFVEEMTEPQFEKVAKILKQEGFL